MRLVALLTAGMGIIDVLSGLTPTLHDRMKILEQYSPFGVDVGGHLTSVLAGFALLLSRQWPMETQTPRLGTNSHHPAHLCANPPVQGVGLRRGIAWNGTGNLADLPATPFPCPLGPTLHSPGINDPSGSIDLYPGLRRAWLFTCWTVISL